MLICVFTGFSSGLPLYVLLTLVPGWLRSEQRGPQGHRAVHADPISLYLEISLVAVARPLRVPWLGRRRGWMLITQCALLLAIGLIGALCRRRRICARSPALAAITAFLSASQDIVLDAYRREILSDAELGLGTAVHVNAYKIAGLIPGSLSLVLADHFPWPTGVMRSRRLFMLPGIGDDCW